MVDLWVFLRSAFTTSEGNLHTELQQLRASRPGPGGRGDTHLAVDTQPPCGATVSGSGNPRPPRASAPAVAALAPACRARQHPAHATASAHSPRPRPESRADGSAPADWATRTPAAVGSATRTHIAAVSRVLGRQPTCFDRQRQRRVRRASAVYQQVALSVTASASGTLGALPVPA